MTESVTCSSAGIKLSRIDAMMAWSRQAACQLTRVFTRTQSSSSVRFLSSLYSIRGDSSRNVQGSLLTVVALFPTARHNMSSSATTTNTISNDNVSVTCLKNMIKPFFLKCHPDVQSTVVAKRVNLKALQTINGLLDVTQATCDGKVVEWPTLLHVEFVISVEERIKKDIVEANYSRRKVELVVPSESLRNAVVQKQPSAVRRLLYHVRLEFAKLLKVAGLPTPVVLEGSDDDDPMEAAWQEELDFVDGAGRTRTFQQQQPRAKTRYERSRERFVRNVDWRRIRQLCKEAVEDMEADLATEGSVRENAKRTQAVITNILSKVRVADDIPVIEQLIAFRRLSLILEDNFDELYMEDMGRMWDNLVIVLKKERDFNTSKSAMRKRSKRAQETGYQFSYGTNGVVTIHIPIDFGDEELVAELDRNLWDFRNLVGDGVEDLYPRWFTE